ncbi:unnamed protein product [Adineta steineri]|uniref:Uncharacterized protein n=1 Tax=Adineta steineri TaxID=433720 RepID=A0A818QQG6_9BILA|nr:unnamed protein product [Adineta steineri]CAF1074365.1 unnamed protein product [Adineta steineri]CAF3644343.1 unnamed protein product [Adineta steineri]CAF4236094.1 unnamed protein product [Adineta steineri]
MNDYTPVPQRSDASTTRTITQRFGISNGFIKIVALVIVLIILAATVIPLGAYFVYGAFHDNSKSSSISGVRNVVN